MGHAPIVEATGELSCGVKGSWRAVPRVRRHVYRPTWRPHLEEE